MSIYRLFLLVILSCYISESLASNDSNHKRTNPYSTEEPDAKRQRVNGLEDDIKLFEHFINPKNARRNSHTAVPFIPSVSHPQVSIFSSLNSVPTENIPLTSSISPPYFPPLPPMPYFIPPPPPIPHFIPPLAATYPAHMFMPKKLTYVFGNNLTPALLPQTQVPLEGVKKPSEIFPTKWSLMGKSLQIATIAYEQKQLTQGQIAEKYQTDLNSLIIFISDNFSEITAYDTKQEMPTWLTINHEQRKQAISEYKARFFSNAEIAEIYGLKGHHSLQSFSLTKRVPLIKKTKDSVKVENKWKKMKKAERIANIKDYVKEYEEIANLNQIFETVSQELGTSFKSIKQYYYRYVKKKSASRTSTTTSTTSASTSADSLTESAEEEESVDSTAIDEKI